MDRLTAQTLDRLPAEVGAPSYDRSALVTGVVHIGVGAFHRAHQAMYLDRLLTTGQGDGWAVCGVGLLPGDAAVRDALREQDGLYTLTVKAPDGAVSRQVIGAVAEYLFAPDDPGAVVEKLASPGTRVVSMTVTEGGYGLDPATGRFDLTAPAVVADLARTAGWTTLFGLVVEALARRRERGVAPFTVVSCDNVEDNGGVAREAFSAYAAARDGDLGRWVREHVRFPCSMVDRITPATTAADQAEVAGATGLVDRAAVVCEPFAQWVLEDDFSLGRPPLEQAGVQVVDDVRPYELMKLRLLNASHQAMAYVGVLSGYRWVHDAAADPLVRALMARWMADEARPTLPPVPGMDLDDYCATLLDRFANPALGDTLARLAAFSSDRIPTWVLPPVRENLASGGPVAIGAAIVASWARYAEGTDEAGAPIDVVDQLGATLTPLARDADPDAFLGHRPVFGDLVDDARFADAYRWARASFATRGAQATMTDLLGRTGS